MSSHDSFAASGSSPTRSEGPDFRSENHGSLFLLFPLTERAHSWIEEHLPENAQWFGNAVVVGMSGPSSVVFRTQDWR
jgi:hypothetical protein